MSFDKSWIGKTVGDGRFSIEAWLSGSETTGRLRGRDQHDGATVHIGLTSALDVDMTELSARLAYEIDGVAPLAFIGDVAGKQAPPIDYGHSVIVEIVDPSRPLTELRPMLSPGQKLQVARCVAGTAKLAEARGIALAGFHPDLIRIDEDAARHATLFSRSQVFFANKRKQRTIGEGCSAFSNIGAFSDPAASPRYATRETDVYCLGLLLGWLFTGVHPFAQAASRGYNAWLSSMEVDERDPFLGPPAIGAVLDVALIADPAQRAPIHEIVSMLDALSPDDVREA